MHLPYADLLTFVDSHVPLTPPYPCDFSSSPPLPACHFTNHYPNLLAPESHACTIPWELQTNMSHSQDGIVLQPRPLIFSVPLSQVHLFAENRHDMAATRWPFPENGNDSSPVSPVNLILPPPPENGHGCNQIAIPKKWNDCSQIPFPRLLFVRTLSLPYTTYLSPKKPDDNSSLVSPLLTLRPHPIDSPAGLLFQRTLPKMAIRRGSFENNYPVAS